MKKGKSKLKRKFAVSLSPRLSAVLEHVAWARFLSRSQITRLHFVSKRTAQRGIALIAAHGFVRIHCQGEARHLERLCTLTIRGADYINEESAVSVKATRLPRLPKLRHAMGIRDVFVAFLLAERRGELSVEDFRFEEDLTREPMFAAHGLIPDAIAVLRDSPCRMAAIEFDLGTESTTIIRAKVAAWKDYFAAERAAERPPTQLLFVTPSSRRAATIERILREDEVDVAVLLTAQIDTALGGIFQCSRELYATPIRAARTAEPVSFHAVESIPRAAFRAAVAAPGVVDCE